MSWKANCGNGGLVNGLGRRRGRGEPDRSWRGWRWWDRVTEYADVISGAKFSRQGLDKLLADVRRSELDVIVCFKLDRLGRSLPHLAQIVGALTTHRVALVCPSQEIDTSGMNPASQLQLNILMAIAEFERSIIQERVTAGLRAAKATGTKLGRPGSLSRHAEAVLELLAEGKGVRAIARELGLPVSSAHRLVRKAGLAREGLTRITNPRSVDDGDGS